MIDAIFLEEARKRTVELFYAYCHENDMEKTLSYFSKNSSFLGWGAKEIYLDYAAICATAYERMTSPYYLELSNIQTEVINATQSFCVVLLTATITYHMDKNNTVQELERATVVFRKEQGEAKIVYLHSSAANKIQSLGKIIPLEHGAEATRMLTQLEYERSMAVDMCNYSPNGLLYCLIGEHYPMVYANQTLCNLLGCKDFAELMEFTKGEMECTIYQEDLPRVKQALLSHVNGVPYTINYRLVDKHCKTRWVTERGVYIRDAVTEEEYYVCTIIPLDLEQQNFSYGNLVDYNYVDNAKISVELFLQQTLEYNDFKNRPAVCIKLLQHLCETLQVSGGVVFSIRDKADKIKPIYYFDVNKHPISSMMCNFTWEQMVKYFSKNGFSTCSDLNAIPDNYFQDANTGSIKSAISKIITINGQDAYLLTLFHRYASHNWTENEQDILEQASKLYALLLDDNF